MGKRRSYEEVLNLKLNRINFGYFSFVSKLFKVENGKLVLACTKEEILECIEKEILELKKNYNGAINKSIEKEKYLCEKTLDEIPLILKKPTRINELISLYNKNGYNDMKTSYIKSFLYLIVEIYKLKDFIDINMNYILFYNLK